MPNERSEPANKKIEGDRNVTAGGDVNDSVIVTGDGNTVIVSPKTDAPIAKPLPIHVPGREWDWRLWWEWLNDRRRRVVVFMAALLLVWIAISTLLQIPPFRDRNVWYGQQFYGEGAWRMVSTADRVYVLGRNPQTSCSATATRGLWQRRSQEGAWEEIKLPVEVPNAESCKHFAAIVDLAVAPSNPQVLYAATDEKGLLRSRDGGATWTNPVSSTVAQLGPLLDVEVALDNPEGLVVIVSGGGIYRSENGGESWQPLDQQPPEQSVCADGTFPFTKRLSARSLFMHNDLIVAGTSQPLRLNSSNVPIGLYASRDNGKCWRKLDDGVGQLEFFTLAFVPTPDANEGTLLFLAKDWDQNGAANSLGLWRVDMNKAQPVQTNLWRSSQNISSLYAYWEENQIRWYIADIWGRIYTSTTDRNPDDYAVMPWLNRCFGCQVDLAANPFGERVEPPLYLSANRVWQIAPGPWWRLLWQG